MAGINPRIDRVANDDLAGQQLRSLIRRYAETDSARVAHAIVRHIDVLRDHPAFDGAPE